jgi:hypothetical protein
MHVEVLPMAHFGRNQRFSTAETFFGFGVSRKGSTNRLSNLWKFKGECDDVMM